MSEITNYKEFIDTGSFVARSRSTGVYIGIDENSEYPWYPTYLADALIAKGNAAKEQLTRYINDVNNGIFNSPGVRDFELLQVFLIANRSV